MNKKQQKGFIAIETVIISALILSVGFSIVAAFRAEVQSATTHVLATFSESYQSPVSQPPEVVAPPKEIILNNIYHPSYNIQKEDINPESDFL